MGRKFTHKLMLSVGAWAAVALLTTCRQTSDTHIDEPFKLTMKNQTREEKCLELSGYQWERHREMCLKTDQYSCTGVKKIWRNGRCFGPDSELPKVCPELSFYDGDKCVAQRPTNLYTSCLDPTRAEMVTVLRLKKKFGAGTCQSLWDIVREQTELEFANVGNLDWPTIARLQHLQRLKLINANLSEVNLSSLESLVFADFSHNPLTEVAGVSRAGALKELRLTATRLVYAGSLLNSNSIQKLSIANSNLSSQSFPEGLAKVNTTLRELTLAENDLIAVDFAAQLLSIEFLDLSGNKRLSSIAGLTEILSLRELDIRNTSVRDLSPLRNNPDLNLRIDDRTAAKLDPALCPVDAASAEVRELCLSIQVVPEPIINPGVGPVGESSSNSPSGDSAPQDTSDEVESTSDVPQNDTDSSSAEDPDRADG